MTFGKYMDANLCCFIPGKIMDEIYNVLRILKNTSPSNSRDQKDAPRTYEVLQVWTLEFIFHKNNLSWDRSFHFGSWLMSTLSYELFLKQIDKSWFS